MQKIQLTIAEPCHENWQQMTPTEQGRYCNACAKVVVDFSTMTDGQVLNYFSSLKNEKVCGRLLPMQMDRTISRPTYPKRKLFWYWNYIVMCFMFFGKMGSAKAQGNVQQVTTEQLNQVKQSNINRALAGKIGRVAQQTLMTVTGRVTDQDGLPVSFASIMIKGTRTGVSADAVGAYSIKVKHNDVLVISAARFKTLEQSVGTTSTLISRLEKQVSDIRGEVVVTVAGGISFRNMDERVFNDRILLGNISTVKVSTSPIYVVDGTIRSGEVNISPDDIQDMTVLQAAEAMAIFGREGRDGAIVITTRKKKEISLKEVAVASDFGLRRVCHNFSCVVKGVNVKQPAATAVIESQATLSVYPNPVKSGQAFNLGVRLQEAQPIQVNVHDASGRVVMQKQIAAKTREFTQQLLAAKNWSSGLYYISITNNRKGILDKKVFMIQ